VVATNDRDALSALEMVALLTKVVQTKDIEMAEMKIKYDEKIAYQDEKIAKIEALLTNLALKTPHKNKDQLTVNLK
jgi:hypothetical protein